MLFKTLAREEGPRRAVRIPSHVKCVFALWQVSHALVAFMFHIPTFV